MNGTTESHGGPEKSLNIVQDASTCELQGYLITGTTGDGINHSIANEIENVEYRGAKCKLLRMEQTSKEKDERSEGRRRRVVLRVAFFRYPISLLCVSE